MRISLRLLLMLLLVSPLLAIADKTVLVIESYHAEYPWDKSYLQGLRNTLGSNYRIETFEMDTKRLPKQHYQAQADKAWYQFRNLRPDLVVLGDDNAVKFLAHRMNAMRTPVVYLGVNGSRKRLGLTELKNVTGVLERPLFQRSITQLNRVMEGKLGSILVLFDSGTTSRTAVEEAFQNQLMMTLEGVKVRLKLVDTLKDWRRAIERAPADGIDAIIVGLFHTLVDESDNHVPSVEVLNWTSENAKVPLFAFWDFAVGKGKTAGGLVLFGESQGIEAGKIVKQIFAGQRPSSIAPVVAEQGRFYFSNSELTRWGINVPFEIRQQATFVD